MMSQMKRALQVLSTLDTLEHLVFSTLPSTTQATSGHVTGVRHFDGKGAATDFLRTSLPDVWEKTTALWVGIYFQASKLFPLAPNKNEQGVYVQAMTAKPETRIPMVDVRDTGVVVGAILSKEKEVKGKVVKVFNDLAVQDMLATWSNITSKPTHYHQLSNEEGEAGIEQLGLKGYRASSLVDLPYALREFAEMIYSEKGAEDGVEVMDAKDLIRLRAWGNFVDGEEWGRVFDGRG